MRRIRLSIVALAATTLWATAVHGQEVRIGGGAGFPVEPSSFTDLYGLGYHGGLEIAGRIGKKKQRPAKLHERSLAAPGELATCNTATQELEQRTASFAAWLGYPGSGIPCSRSCC